ncbi:UvrD-helicase domain-containing protein [Geomonas nitrogeniifigens]|uniref:DNA 3'-5' helicase n=1 Tax=Geomonas diazotrophica TaxID=2843197 RepID=A0ABX8JGF9_9BACT|nr:UvrD-helicase domain-containing protein [Geomonas nitrogeniifigens]QWV96226.1 UvrD-helicase domain-containing protein [Geomonas nitrogeniifigens]QXE85293.1 UvrD-helicase domain-containing protein [Geomonas nitrogeniifigens]
MLDLSRLNPEQLAAVKHTEGALLVLAGAGSGKTGVITYRIAHLVLNKLVPPDRILAVTFTNKAAKEMKERVEHLVGRKESKGIVLSTFHSLGVRVLKRDIERLGYKKNFSIYSTADQVGLVRQIVREVNTDSKKYDAESIIWRISGAKNKLIPPDRYAPNPVDDVDMMAALVYPRYQSALKAFNAIDFDDIIMLTAELLQHHPPVLKHWQERFSYIMVDEYQDTNSSQYLLVNLLAAGCNNLCVVGDDDQSIYGWRGADVGNILDFEKDFKGCRTIKLEQNYRSTGNILEAANSVIGNNKVRKAKRLWTASGQGALIDLCIVQDDEEEATSVVERIQLERFKKDIPYSDFAILYRTNAQSRAFEEQLRFEDIPYVLVGGTQFFERKEVKDSLSYLKVIANPLDEVALLRIVNFPRRGIGDSTVIRINQWSLEKEIPLFEAFSRVGEIEGISDAIRDKVLGFHQTLLEAADSFRVEGGLAEKGKTLFEKLKIEEEIFRTIDDQKAARRKVENVEQIINSMAAYEERVPQATLGGFIEKVSLMDEDRFSGKDKKDHGKDAVTLMSLHSSKGLEFPFVFLVGMEDEILPHRRAIYEDDSIDEERRLCYVGITRARQQLVMTRTLFRKKYGKLEERVPSRFLEEIPATVLNVQQSGVAKEVAPEEAEKSAEDFFAKMRAMMG